MKYLKMLVVIILLVMGAISLFLIYLTMNQYSPEDSVVIETIPSVVLEDGKDISILTWNIGYAGIGAAASSYLDGGSQSGVEEAFMLENLNGIKSFLKKTDSDIILLQEVDKASTRSSMADQEEIISQYLDGYYKTFVYDYKVDFYPLPLDKMVGKIHSGFMTLGKTSPESAVRYGIKKEESWPISVFSKDECLLVWEYAIRNGKKLLVYNINLSGYYDYDSLMKDIGFIRNKLLEDFIAGNYVIAGGDWGITLPGYARHDIGRSGAALSFSRKISDDWTPAGWSWAYSDEFPSARSAATPFGSDNGFSTVDGFLVSPNISLIACEAYNLQFANSDHNPYKITIRLR